MLQKIKDRLFRKPAATPAPMPNNELRDPVDPFCFNLDLVPTNNDWGESGESFFAYMMKKYHFQAYFLGEKAPTKDFLVHFIVDAKYTYSFLVQVKTPIQAQYTKQETKISVPDFNSKDVELLSNHTDATYLCVVDLNRQKLYFRGVFGEKNTISSIATTHKLDNNPDAQQRNGILLYQLAKEVIKYHNEIIFSNKPNFKTVFI